MQTESSLSAIGERLRESVSLKMAVVGFLILILLIPVAMLRDLVTERSQLRATAAAFETMGQLQLHPMQYLLVGFANALFYLLLLSLAEHTGFGVAYVLSAGASIGLIAGYSRSVLGRAGGAVIMAGLLAGLYLFLYLVLQAEDYAMLAGALGLWIILASIMFLTRHIDWYRPRAAKNGI